MTENRHAAAAAALENYHGQLVALTGVINATALVTCVGACAENPDLWPLLRMPALLFALGVVMAFLIALFRLFSLELSQEPARLNDDFYAAREEIRSDPSIAAATRILDAAYALDEHTAGTKGRALRRLRVAQLVAAALAAGLFLIGLIMGGDNMLEGYGPAAEPARKVDVAVTLTRAR